MKSKADPGKCGPWQGGGEGEEGRHHLGTKGKGVLKTVLLINNILK